MTTIDAKSKQATMDHMNREHSLDLGLYLRFVNGLSAKQLAAEGTPELVHIDLKSLYIRTATTGTVHVVPLDPPMAVWGDRRQRLIDLAMDARKAFGVPLPEHGAPPAAAASSAAASSTTAGKEFVPFDPPGALDFLAMLGVVSYFVLCGLMYTGRDEVTSNTWASVLGAVGITKHNFVFGGADGFRLMLRLTAIPILAIHVTESWWMVRTRLHPRGMKALSVHGLAWTSLTFLMGFRSFIQFDKVARRQARKAAGATKKH